MTTVLLALSLFLAPQSAAAPLSAQAVKITPKPVAEFEMSKLKGVIRRIAWNADNTQLYVQTAELGSDAQPKALHHYLVDPGTGALKNADAEPSWAATYWEWKSWKAAPDDENFAIQVSEEQREGEQHCGHFLIVSNSRFNSTAFGWLARPASSACAARPGCFISR
jgi:hypothetical protein